VSFASGANVLCGSLSVTAIVDNRSTISVLGDVEGVQDEIKQMAGHNNMASLVLEKAMVMEEYIIGRSMKSIFIA
jgi:hypothetical protein